MSTRQAGVSLPLLLVRHPNIPFRGAGKTNYQRGNKTSVWEEEAIVSPQPLAASLCPRAPGQRSRNQQTSEHLRGYVGGRGTSLLLNLEPGLPFSEFWELGQLQTSKFNSFWKQLDGFLLRRARRLQQCPQPFLDPVGQGLHCGSHACQRSASTSSPISSPCPIRASANSSSGDSTFGMPLSTTMAAELSELSAGSCHIGWGGARGEAGPTSG